MGATWGSEGGGGRKSLPWCGFWKGGDRAVSGGCGEGKASNVFDLITGGPTGLAGEGLSLPKKRL